MESRKLALPLLAFAGGAILGRLTSGVLPEYPGP